MSHVRQRIRERIAELIQNVPVVVADSVDESNEYPRTTTELPTFTVHVSNEQVREAESTIGSTRKYARLATFIITIQAKGASGVDDTLDDWCEVVEEIMDADRTLSGLAIDSQLLETELELSVEAEQITGRAMLSYAVEYFTEAGVPSAPAA